MKMITAIVNKEDAKSVTRALIEEGFSITRLSTTGGFLMAGTGMLEVAKMAWNLLPRLKSADLMEPLPERPAKQFEKPEEKRTYFADFASNSTVEDAFPFSIWSKLLKEVMAENSKELMSRSPSKGVYELRSAVAGYTSLPFLQKRSQRAERLRSL